MQPVPAAASPYAPPASAAAAGGNAGFSDYSTEHEDHKEEMVRWMEQTDEFWLFVNYDRDETVGGGHVNVCAKRANPALS